MASEPMPEGEEIVVTPRNIVDPPSKAEAGKYAKTFYQLGVS